MKYLLIVFFTSFAAMIITMDGVIPSNNNLGANMFSTLAFFVTAIVIMVRAKKS